MEHGFEVSADGHAGIPDRKIETMVREAEEEALAEAKAIVKDSMVKSILQRAEELSRTPSRADEAASDCEQVRREIESIRTKIAENETLLQTAASSGEHHDEPEQAAESADDGHDDEKACYVYGVIAEDGHQPLQDLGPSAIDPDYPLYGISCRDVRAIVSPVSTSEFGQKAVEANLEDMDWLGSKVRAHEAVLEAASDRCTVIPMRFCTVYLSEGRVREMLGEHYDAFKAALAQLDGKREWGVKCFCDRELLADKVRQTSEGVKPLRTQTAQEGRGTAYFMKKKMEEAIAAEVERVSDECAEQTHDRLSSRASRAVANPLRDQGLTGRTDEMILNGAYLVVEDELATFRDELDGLKAEYESLGFSYELTGPWPAYNFAAIGAQEASDAAVGA